MAGYLGTKAVFLSTTAATVTGSSTVGAGLTVDNDGATVLTVDRASTDGTIIDVQRGGTSTATIGVSASDDVYFAGATGSTKGIYFNANGLLPATTGGGASDGTVDIGEGITRWKDLYLSGGVYLGGTGSANLLDDYEEGTWTPTLVGSVTAGSSPTGVGLYLKVGSLVTVTASFNNFTVSSASGNAYITGLPFSANGTTAYGAHGPVLINSMGTDVLGSSVLSGENFIRLRDAVTTIFEPVTNGSALYLFTTVTYQTT